LGATLGLSDRAGQMHVQSRRARLSLMTEEKYCIATGDEITPANDSKAHVVPSALGGRLKPRGILCQRGNEILGSKLDQPLIEAFQPLMNLLNGSRDRGQNQPTIMTDESGKKYLFRFGQHLALTAHEYEETETAGVTHITIKARDLREARTLLGRVKAKNPKFDVDEAMKHAVEEHDWPVGMLGHQFQIGPIVTFPAAFVAASIFASFHGLEVHPGLKRYITDFDLNNPTLPPDTFYFMPEPRWISTPGAVAHVLSLSGDGGSGRLFAYIEYFNLVGIGVLLPFAGTQDIRVSYAIDLLSGKEPNLYIYPSRLKGLPWAATHQLGESSLFSLTQSRFEDVIKLALARGFDALSSGMIERAFGAPDGRPLNASAYANLIGEVADYLERSWKRPEITREMRRDQLAAFDGLCSNFSGHIPVAARLEFSRMMTPHRDRVVRSANLGESN
jgi:hypothetical protein